MHHKDIKTQIRKQLKMQPQLEKSQQKGQKTNCWLLGDILYPPMLIYFYLLYNQ